MLQLQNMSLMCSNNVTVVLAVERFIAVTRPIDYHVNVTSSGQSPWRRVSAYMVPTVLFSIAFNVPKFFEIKGVPDIRQVRVRITKTKEAWHARTTFQYYYLFLPNEIFRISHMPIS